jgi:hypothetical protein
MGPLDSRSVSQKAGADPKFVFTVAFAATCGNVESEDAVHVEDNAGTAGGGVVVEGVVIGKVVSNGRIEGSNTDRDDLPLIRRIELFLLMRLRSWRDGGR